MNLNDSPELSELPLFTKKGGDNSNFEGSKMQLNTRDPYLPMKPKNSSHAKLNERVANMKTPSQQIEKRDPYLPMPQRLNTLGNQFNQKQQPMHQKKFQDKVRQK
jgi:hypothetical protein